MPCLIFLQGCDTITSVGWVLYYTILLIGSILLAQGRAFVSDWKNKGAVPSAPNLKKIADYFGVSTDYLLGNTDIKNPPDQQSPEEIAKVALFGGDGEVTDEMWNEVKGFVEFIKDKRKRENDNN